MKEGSKNLIPGVSIDWENWEKGEEPESTRRIREE